MILQSFSRRTVGGVALALGEIVAVHAVLVFDLTDDWLDGGAPFQLAFDLDCDAALQAGGEDVPVVKTWNLRAGGALWPLLPASARTRLMPAPVRASMSGSTVSSVWRSFGRPGSVLAWMANWPPFERLSVVAVEALTPNS